MLRTFWGGCLSAAVLVLGWMGPAITSADGAPAGPGRGAGERSVGRTALFEEVAPVSEERKAPPKTHRIGKHPQEPRAVLPPGVAPAEPDWAARRAVSNGFAAPGTSQITDPELRALRDAERVLFPKSLTGFQSGWSWGKLNPSAQEQGLPPVVQAMPSATREDAALAEWLRTLSMPNFPVKLDARVVKYLKFYRDTKRGQAIAKAWARKVGRYTAAMQAELSKAGLPKDLVWISLIESGHNPTAASPAGAAGMWQFIPESARMYGLTVDRWVDERLDPERATQAAAQFLSDLYQRFGTWELAMAAYNMGHAGLLRAVRKYNTNDFWTLSRYEAGIPWETSLYVPKILAIAIVMNNRRAFGLNEIEPDAPIVFDTLQVGSSVRLEDVARASGVSLEALRSINPQYLSAMTPAAPHAGEKTPARRWTIKVPRGKGVAALQRLSQGKQAESYPTTVVRFGDTLSTVAARWQVSERELLSLNGLGANSSLRPGSVLLLPKSSEAPLPDEEEVVVVPQLQADVPGRQRVFYRVLSGDTLESIATAMSVSTEELVTWNRLDRDANLQSGMTLQVFLPPVFDRSSIRHVTADSTRIVEAGTEAFVDYFEGLQGRTRLTIRAKSGDTLSSIGQRYGLSTGMMERINRFSRHKKLKPGEIVIVYAKQKQKDDADSERKPLVQASPPRPDVLPSVVRQEK